MVGTARMSQVNLLIQEKDICSCGWKEEAGAPAHNCSGQLCWCCQPGLPPVHLLQLTWRVSRGLVHQRRRWRDQAQGPRGQPGVLHLISSPVQICSSKLFWMNHLSKLQFINCSSLIYLHIHTRLPAGFGWGTFRFGSNLFLSSFTGGGGGWCS